MVCSLQVYSQKYSNFNHPFNPPLPPLLGSVDPAKVLTLFFMGWITLFKEPCYPADKCPENRQASDKRYPPFEHLGPDTDISALIPFLSSNLIQVTTKKKRQKKTDAGHSKLGKTHGIANLEMELMNCLPTIITAN